jgi:uncharacterized protein (TIGR02246 family)
MNTNPADVATTLAQALEDAWNAADAQAWGAQFSTYADFVTSQAEYHRGRQAIVWGHSSLFGSIFKDSKVHYEPLSARLLASDLLSAQIAATLNCPVGPMQGENQSTISIVAKLRSGQWQIELFHNTIRPPTPISP